MVRISFIFLGILTALFCVFIMAAKRGYPDVAAIVMILTCLYLLFSLIALPIIWIKKVIQANRLEKPRKKTNLEGQSFWQEFLAEGANHLKWEAIFMGLAKLGRFMFRVVRKTLRSI